MCGLGHPYALQPAHALHERSELSPLHGYEAIGDAVTQELLHGHRLRIAGLAAADDVDALKPRQVERVVIDAEAPTPHLGVAQHRTVGINRLQRV